PAALVGYLKRALAGPAKDAAERLRELTQLRERGLQVALAHRDLDAIAAHHRHADQREARVPAQHAPHVVAQLIELLLADRRGIDLVQQMRAAPEVEAEHDLALRPFRPTSNCLLREEIRHSQQAHKQRGKQDAQCLQARYLHHDRASLTQEIASFGGRTHRTHQATISLVRVNAVNTVVMMPMPSVTAKPRTGPVPMKNSTAAAMKVVVLE